MTPRTKGMSGLSLLLGVEPDTQVAVDAHIQIEEPAALEASGRVSS